jgi:hypothetical protein
MNDGKDKLSEGRRCISNKWASWSISSYSIYRVKRNYDFCVIKNTYVHVVVDELNDILNTSGHTNYRTYAREVAAPESRSCHLIV